LSADAADQKFSLEEMTGSRNNVNEKKEIKQL
jgi:hypothetical protein